MIVTELILMPLVLAPFAAASDQSPKFPDFPTYPKPAHFGVPVLSGIPLQVNVLFLGVPPEVLDIQRIHSQLDQWYAQINRDRYRFTGQMEIYTNFSMKYNFASLPKSLSDAYTDFLSSQHYEGEAPFWLRTSASNAWYVDAYKAETWLKENLPIPNEGYSLIIIDTHHSSNPVSPSYFYDGTLADPDTNQTPKEFYSKYMIGYGGTYRFLFLDLSAGPTCNRFEQAPCPNNADVRHIDTYDFTNSAIVANFNDDLARYIRFALELRFAPSFLYRPVFRDSFYLNVTIFSGDPEVQYSRYLNMSLIARSFKALLPLSNFSYAVREVPIESDPRLYALVQSATNADGSLNGNLLEQYFLQNYRTYVTRHGSDRVIPIFILAGYRIGFFGKASPSGSGSFAFVLEAINQQILSGGNGLTYVTIHETSHAFGLPHPHDGFDWNAGVFTFWAYDYSGSLTTYELDNIVPDQLNYDQRDVGSTALLLNQTYTYLQATDKTLNRLGYTETPPSVMDYAKIALNYSSTAVSLFSQPNPNYENASVEARVGLMAAQSAYATAVKLPQATTSLTTSARESSTISSSVTQAQTQSVGLATPNSTGSVDYTLLIGVIVFIVSVTIAAYGLWQRSKAKTARS